MSVGVADDDSGSRASTPSGVVLDRSVSLCITHWDVEATDCGRSSEAPDAVIATFRYSADLSCRPTRQLAALSLSRAGQNGTKHTVYVFGSGQSCFVLLFSARKDMSDQSRALTHNTASTTTANA